MPLKVVTFFSFLQVPTAANVVANQSKSVLSSPNLASLLQQGNGSQQSKVLGMALLQIIVTRNISAGVWIRAALMRSFNVTALGLGQELEVGFRVKMSWDWVESLSVPKDAKSSKSVVKRFLASKSHRLLEIPFWQWKKTTKLSFFEKSLGTSSHYLSSGSFINTYEPAFLRSFI